MPLRGENIGTAYVRIIADGDGLDESIRRSFHDAEPSVREGGKEHGKTYGDAFDEELRKSFKGNFDKTQKQMFEDANTNLTQSLSRLELSKRFFENREWKKFRKRLVNEFGDAGDLAGQELEKHFRDSTNLPGLANVDFGPVIRKAQAKLLKDLAADQQRSEKQRTERHAAMLSEAYQLDHQYNQRVIKESLDLDRKFEVHHKHLADSGARVQKFLREGQVDFRRNHKALDGLTHGISQFADASGLAFGHTSRNNFLNFTGSVVRNLVGAFSGVPHALGLASDALSHITTGFSEGAKEGKGFFSTLSKGSKGGLSALSDVAAAGLPGLLALVAAFVLAVTAIGPLVAIVSALVAGIFALAGAISFAIVGALAPLLGLVAPLGLAFVVLGSAFAGLSKDAKAALQESIKPITSELVKLRKAAQSGLFSNFPQQAKLLKTDLAPLEGLFHRVGAGISDMFTVFLQGMQSPGFKDFIANMSVFIPDVLHRLARIFTNVFGGLGGVFVSLEPVTRSFLRWLEQITAKFSEWSNSTKGQTWLHDFFENARQSAHSVWRLLGDIGGLLATLFSGGRQTGNNVIDDLDKQVRDLRDFLAANPNAIKDWFANGQETIREIGAMVRDVSKAFADLDTPANRQAAHAILQILGVGLRIVAQQIQLVSMQWSLMAGVMHGIRRVVGVVLGAFISNLASVVRAVGTVLVGLGKFVPGAGAAGRALLGAADKADKMANAVRGIPKDHNTKVTVDTGRSRNEISQLQLALASLHSKNLTVTTLFRYQGKPKAGTGNIPGLPGSAMGELISGGETIRRVGEGGLREAIVPLDRPLSEIDPAVRWLAAYAQGKPAGAANGAMVGGGRQVTIGELHLHTPTQDPRAAASEFLNHLVAVAY